MHFAICAGSAMVGRYSILQYLLQLFFMTLAYKVYLVTGNCHTFKLLVYYVIIYYMNSSPIRLKQKLSPKAAAAKKKRDVAIAKTAKRKARKAENQRIGQKSTSDLHHTGRKVKRVSIKSNRGNFGHGTKKE
tara:strand:+ start:263 stop:658 length:396 start_codon:yes stop_codon:yes gene_type:complete